MEGLNRKCEIDLNGKYKGRLENTRVEWKIQGQNGKYKDRMENTRVEWKI